MKKKIIIILAAIALVLIIGFLVKDTRNPNSEIGNGEEGALSQISTFTSSELGLRFSYPVGTNGYVLKIVTPTGESQNTQDSQSLLKTIVLMRAEDVMQAVPVGGEGVPTITISVFKNSKKQFPLVWANQNTQYSNTNLKNGEIMEDVVGGANAIRYMADGLYASENVVVANGENMYVITGMFLDADSALRRDFSPLVKSIEFIPQSEQGGESSEVTFNYPKDLPTKYIHTVDWPPVVQASDGEFTCTNAGTPEQRAGRTEKRTIDGREYCVTEVSEGAAGSIYIQYAYMTEIENKNVFVRFTTRAVQCENYDDPEKTECKNERNSFNIDQVVAEIVQSVKFK